MKKTKKNKNKKSKRKFRIFLLILIFILIIAFAILLLGAYVFKSKIDTIVIHDNYYLQDEEMIQEANLENYPNFYLTTSSKIEKSLEQNELIKEVKVKKKLFFEVHIYITEYKPLFIREDTNKIVLEQGKEIDNNYNLNIPSLVNYVPNTKYEELVEKMENIDNSIINKISDIKYDPNEYDEDRFLLYMNDSNKVYINLPKFKNLNKYNEMVTKFEGKVGTLYLDSGNYFEIEK